MIPGELFIKDGEIELNAGRKTVTLTVANTGDRPIQVGSHYHFFETNPALKFDRKKARGMRLDIAAGTAVRFEPGQTRDVQLVALAGKRVDLRLSRRRAWGSCESRRCDRDHARHEAASSPRAGTRHGAQGARQRAYVNHLAEVANLLASRPMARMPNWSRPVAARHHRGHRHDARGVAQEFGERVADLVVEVTDDMSLPKIERGRSRSRRADKSRSKVIKIATRSAISVRASCRSEPDERGDLADYVDWARRSSGCRGVNAMLDQNFRSKRPKLATEHDCDVT